MKLWIYIAAEKIKFDTIARNLRLYVSILVAKFKLAKTVTISNKKKDRSYV